jgi:chemotaxis protein methyltransferase CheR
MLGVEMDEIVAVMGQAYGLDLSCYDESFLAKSIERRREVTAAGTPAAYLERLTQDRAEAESLYRSLRVTYSEFFRNPLAFALLEQTLLPTLLNEKEEAARTEIRVWSAGCAAGQEPWSVAILLEELGVARGNPVSYRIFATDLSGPDLALARRGSYGVETLGRVGLRRLNEYFLRQDGSYTVAARPRDRVDFSVYDLLDAGGTCPPASIYGGFDLVLCSNVLLYYRPKTQRLILDKVRRSLAPRGYLVTGETERQIVAGAGGFRAVAPPATVFQQMQNRR